jgi:hypothetical protein
MEVNGKTNQKSSCKETEGERSNLIAYQASVEYVAVVIFYHHHQHA